ncbi:MAG: Uma2 family endonuclease [Thermotogae bacterium]|nr:Uma2 family endonuclease [Thermotogota bacterium]
MKEAVLERSKAKFWTYEDYLRNTDEGRYELINGRLEKMPAPSFMHQRVLSKLFVKLRLWVENRGKGEVLPAPFDVILGEKLVVQPDIVFIAKENLKNVKGGRLFGAPDLVVEIVSPQTVRRDTFVKKRLYAEAGVKEYWIVYPEERAIEVWVLKDGKYELHSVAEGEGKVKSEVLKGLEVDVGEVFI